MKNMDRITWDKPVNKIKLDFEPFVKDHRNLAKWEILPIIYDVIIHYMTYMMVLTGNDHWKVYIQGNEQPKLNIRLSSFRKFDSRWKMWTSIAVEEYIST